MSSRFKYLSHSLCSVSSLSGGLLWPPVHLSTVSPVPERRRRRRRRYSLKEPHDALTWVRDAGRERERGQVTGRPTVRRSLRPAPFTGCPVQIPALLSLFQLFSLSLSETLRALYSLSHSLQQSSKYTVYSLLSFRIFSVAALSVSSDYCL